MNPDCKLQNVTLNAVCIIDGITQRCYHLLYWGIDVIVRNSLCFRLIDRHSSLYTHHKSCNSPLSSTTLSPFPSFGFLPRCTP